MDVLVKWMYTGPGEESLIYTRVLYAYLHPKSSEVLYIGKADYCTVEERLKGPHKEKIFTAMVHDLGLSELNAIVGLLHISSERRFSSELLSDTESLLIMAIQPRFNDKDRQSRIARPELVVTCTGDWPHEVTRFEDA